MPCCLQDSSAMQEPGRPLQTGFLGRQAPLARPRAALREGDRPWELCEPSLQLEGLLIMNRGSME